MTDAELRALPKDLESDRVERKEALTDKDRVCEAICAFANDLPNHRSEGVVFVGADDAGKPTGLAITDRLLLEISDLRSNGNILPFPTISVQKKTFDGVDVAVVEVLPSDMPPVRFRGRTWIRVGPRRAIATPEEERRLTEKRRAGDLPFDLRALPTATTDDLDLDLFIRTYLPAVLPADILAENQRTIEQQLASLRFITPDGIPTVVGVVSVGLDPKSLIPGDYVQFVRFDGTDLTAPIVDQKELSGPLSELMAAIEETLQLNISVATEVVGTAQEVQHPDYPLSALQQLARNAILHRSYEATNSPTRISWFNDRIEIQNPGGPFGQVTEDNFGQPGATDYRNPNIAEAMKVLGWVQRFGIGIPTARRELEKNGNPALEFTVNGANVLATITRRP